MKTLIGNTNHYIILHVVIASLWPVIVLEGATMEMQFFCVIPAIAPYIENIKFWIKNFHLAMISKAMLCKFLS